MAITAEGASSSVEWLSGDLIDLLVPFIPILPFLAMFLIIFAGMFKKNYKLNVWIGVLANLGAWLISMLVLVVWFTEYLGDKNAGFPVKEVVMFNWLEGTGWEIKAAFLVDALSVIMISLVSTLTLLIQIYGIAYMKGEEGTKSGRYNAEISLFVGSMLLLALSSNFLLFFIGWELMGVCSYLLIGFFTKKEETNEKGEKINKPASAAKKAFMITKVGDILLMAGFMLFFWQMFTAGVDAPLNFLATQAQMSSENYQMNESIQILIALLIFGGAIGKSAQFPLQIWLPDAMEGPTTVSALIHSATMVKAGVFLVARTFYIFEGTDALLFVGVVGAFTAIFAATLAFVATDIKRVLAYSTISQLGYMFIGLGSYSLTAGMFHLISHSIFKALLFLGAGSIIHSVSSNDMKDMGGLRKYLPKTHITFLIGGLGLTGIIPFNGFFSKDSIIGVAFQKGMDSGNIIYTLMGFSALITALLTGFYFFRLYFRVFSGEREEDHNVDHEHGLPHESPNLMTIPLMILAGLVIITGILSLDGFVANVLVTLGILSFGVGEAITLVGNFNLFNEHVLGELLHYWLLPQGHATEIDLGSWLGFLWIFALGFAIIGIILAWQMYSPGKRLTGFKASFVSSGFAKSIDNLLVQKYYMDDLFLGFATFFKDGVATGFLVLDNTTDAIIDGIGKKTVNLCDLAVTADDTLIDGTVRFLSNSVFRLAGKFRTWQSGVLQSYVSSLSSGLIIIFMVVLLFMLIS
ncbi:MAG: F(420)H(2) dehydrogenase subunit L [Candidatus Heimdallarchaeota archaeon LC_3]|nr:MAG: F(420)H(2) dehydrogenase subunit L [Candidatus Heimdallarchaeota archaeon LC_3]